MDFLEFINTSLSVIVGYVWSLPTVIILISVGIFFTVALGLPQLKGLGHAIEVLKGKFDHQGDPGEISHFQALTTALSATVGLGNIAGVAIALRMGGPGAILWMILAGLLGMATKYAECSLAVKYRKIDDKGHIHGGPMHYIVRGLGPQWKPLASFFAFFCIFASFGAANMFQTNQVASAFQSSFHIPPLATGVLICILTALVILGGIKRIARTTSILVPFMGGIYVLGALIVIIANIKSVPEMFTQIFEGAFSGLSAMGGFAGATVRTALIQGIRRASFSNEAGIGSAPIAHSAATTSEPIREGIVALLEPFVDTVIICTMTALVILLSGQLWDSSLTGVELTIAAFNTVIPGFGQIFIPFAIFLFAYSTLLSWSYYGDRATDFLFNEKEGALKAYKIIFCILTIVGALWKLSPILNFSDICLGLMIAPNIFAILMLFPKLKQASDDYFARLKSGQMKPEKPTT